MSDTYIIEVRSEPAGIVVRERGGFRFFAASETFNRMEGQYFRSAREAEREALAQAKSREGKGDDARLARSGSPDERSDIRDS